MLRLLLETLPPLGPISSLPASSGLYSWWSGWAGHRGGVWHPVLRRDLGELCGSGSGWERVVIPCVGVHVNLGPTGHRARPVVSSHEAKLLRRQSSLGVVGGHGGTSASHWPYTPCLALCALSLFLHGELGP